MTELEVTNMMIARYRDIVDNWESYSLSDIIDIFLNNACLLRPYHVDCYKPGDCVGYAKVCGNIVQVTHAANHDWPKEPVKKYMLESLQMLVEMKEQLEGNI